MRHALFIAALLLLAVAVQGVVVCRSVVPALDSGRFLVTAEWMDREGMLETVRSQPEQPLYSMWVWAVRRTIVATAGNFPALGAVTVQLAAALPLVLIVVPVYLLSLRVYGQAGAIAGTCLFCVLPEVARLGADGISDSTHLLLLAIAFWAVFEFLTGPAGRGAMANLQQTAQEDGQPWAPGSPWWLLLAGLATGTAALVRTEALMLPVALATGGLALAFLPAQRRLFPRLLAASACFLVGLLLILASYLAVTGATSPRAAVARLVGRPGPARLSVPAPSPAPAVADWQLPEDGPMCFAPKDASSSRHRGLGGAVRTFGRELAEAFWYWVGLLGIAALWMARRLAAKPVDWFLRIFVGVFSLGVLAFGAREGYLSARHLLPLVIVGIGCCGLGVVEAGYRLARLFRVRRSLANRWATGVLALACAACLGQTLLPVGRCAEAHRAAARWLVAEAKPGIVIDTKGWSRLYSGRKTYQYADGVAAFADPGVHYVVVEPWELQGESPRSRTLRRLLATAGQQAVEFAGPEDDFRRAVTVYRWQPERLRPGSAAVATDAQRVHDARTSASLCPKRR